MTIDQIKEDFKQAQATLDSFISAPEVWEKIENAGELMFHALKSGNKIISCGNGGSMCDAMHFAEELTGRYRENRPAFPAIAISDPSHITCVANDFGFEYIFSRAVEAWGTPGDILLVITSSGNSQNIVEAAKAASRKGIKVIALTGKTGGKIAALCDVEIRAPKSEYADRVQEIHIKVIHAFILMIELKMNFNLNITKYS